MRIEAHHSGLHSVYTHEIIFALLSIGLASRPDGSEIPLEVCCLVLWRRPQRLSPITSSQTSALPSVANHY